MACSLEQDVQAGPVYSLPGWVRTSCGSSGYEPRGLQRPPSAPVCQPDSPGTILACCGVSTHFSHPGCPIRCPPHPAFMLPGHHMQVQYIPPLCSQACETILQETCGMQALMLSCTAAWLPCPELGPCEARTGSWAQLMCSSRRDQQTLSMARYQQAVGWVCREAQYICDIGSQQAYASVAMYDAARSAQGCTVSVDSRSGPRSHVHT